MRQLPQDTQSPDSIFHRFYSPTPVTLSEVVKFVGWGHNKLIRDGGIRISSICSGLQKTWQQIKDPDYIISSKKYISASKGRTIIVIEIGGINEKRKRKHNAGISSNR